MEQKEYIATFFTDSGAIRYNRYLRQKGITAETMPVPRKLSANCGLSVRFLLAEDVTDFISQDIDELFEIMGKDARLVYRSQA